MGSGKSSVGRLLARQCGRPCFDTDEMVETALGMPVSRIFEQLGEARFRDAETAALEKLDGISGAIIVTGGGIVLRRENIRRLRELGTVVWLTADVATLRERLSRGKERPLLPKENRAEVIAELLEQRENFYKEAAHLVVDTSRLDHRQVAQAICDGLQINR